MKVKMYVVVRKRKKELIRINNNEKNTFVRNCDFVMNSNHLKKNNILKNVNSFRVNGRLLITIQLMHF